MDNWEGISEFVAVAQTNSFTGAARQLSTSVAQVSRRVARLEERLAVKLLNRTTRRVSLTEAGQLYYQQCAHLVEGLRQAELAVTQMQSSPSGLIRLTAPVNYGELYLAPLLVEFMQQYPQLDIRLELTNQRLDLIESGIDMAVRLGKLEDSTLIAKRLASRQLHVCASPAYLERYGEPHTLSELGQHQCLVGSIEYWRFQEQGKEAAIRVHGRLRCNGGIALAQAARQGLGLVQLPDYYVREALESGELVEVLRDYRESKEGIWALYPQNRHLPAKVKLLIDFLSERLASHN